MNGNSVTVRIRCPNDSVLVGDYGDHGCDDDDANDDNNDDDDDDSGGDSGGDNDGDGYDDA